MGTFHIIDSVSTTVYRTVAGTRCWIAPEVLTSKANSVDMNRFESVSDMFSCGMLLHYIILGQKHPFHSTDCASKSELQVSNETETKIMKDKMDEWDDSLPPEATHLVKRVLASNEKDRPSAEEALEHPLFWSIEPMLFNDFVFLAYFPDLLMEVYKLVTTHNWDRARGDIKCAMDKK